MVPILHGVLDGVMKFNFLIPLVFLFLGCREDSGGVIPTSSGGASPIAELDYSEYRVFLGRSIVYSGRRSHDPDGGSLNYTWDLGDGTKFSSIVDSVEHVYTREGTYKVTLLVVDSDGDFDVFTAVAEVHPPSILVPSISSGIL